MTLLSMPDLRRAEVDVSCPLSARLNSHHLAWSWISVRAHFAPRREALFVMDGPFSTLRWAWGEDEVPRRRHEKEVWM